MYIYYLRIIPHTKPNIHTFNFRSCIKKSRRFPKSPFTDPVPAMEAYSLFSEIYEREGEGEREGERERERLTTGGDGKGHPLPDTVQLDGTHKQCLVV